eukprot:gene22325-8771_t
MGRGSAICTFGPETESVAFLDDWASRGAGAVAAEVARREAE